VDKCKRLAVFAAQVLRAWTGTFLDQESIPGNISPASFINPLHYALNNPVLLTDPSEKNPLLLVGALGGLLGGAIYGYGSQVVRNLK
jgi:hypothetical protein